MRGGKGFRMATDPRMNVGDGAMRHRGTGLEGGVDHLSLNVFHHAPGGSCVHFGGIQADHHLWVSGALFPTDDKEQGSHLGVDATVCPNWTNSAGFRRHRCTHVPAHGGAGACALWNLLSRACVSRSMTRVVSKVPMFVLVTWRNDMHDSADRWQHCLVVLLCQENLQ